MIVYVPATFDDHDYNPSWTGNNAYPTITIRGIFDSYKLAEAAAKDWNVDSYIILEKYCGDDDQFYEAFDIDYENHELAVWGVTCGRYTLNEVVEEIYSAVWDENRALGVTDW